jgi:hypothetical protein
MRPSDSKKGATARGGGICDHLLNGNDRQARFSRSLELRVVWLRAREIPLSGDLDPCRCEHPRRVR